MNATNKLYRYGRTAFVHLGLVLLLVLTSVAVASATPNAPDRNGNGGNQGRHRGHYKVRRLPVEQKGTPTQPQHPIAPPVGAAAVAGAEQNQRAYLPLITQGESAQVEAAAINLPVDMRLLVISADGKETDYPAIRSFLDQLGIPYDVLIASQTPLTAAKLSNGTTHGYYQGIILITGNLSFFNPATHQWESGFDTTEWNTLWNYEAQFGVRQVTSYTYPGSWPDSYGLNYVTYQDTTTTPLNATLTTAGQKIYPYLKASTPVTIKNAWVYLATIASTTVTTPLLTSGTYAIASINYYPNGRQNLTVTAANNPYLLHSLLLSYGTINWVTKGLFLGERHVYMDPQIDDILIDDDLWSTTALTDTVGLTFRMAATDLTAAIAWQNSARTTYPVANTLKLEWAFNGEGTTGIYTPDTLTPAVQQNQGQFAWINHTYTHANLDTITTTLATQELSLNHNAATTQLRLTTYSKDAMVQPDISGLYNAQFQQAAVGFGIKYLISDTSQPGWNNPSPNAGFYSTLQPSLLIIPRRPSNLFYNLSTPAEWVSEYNCYYGPTGTCARGAWRYWDHNLSYTEILDKESDLWLQYLLKWDSDPLMFHQPNVRAYERPGLPTSNRSLLGDLLNATLAKYNQVYTLPVVGITEHNIGIKMASRMGYNASGVKATVTCSATASSITLTTVKPALLPVTGVSYGANTETYGGQNISYIQLAANQSLTLAGPACK